MNDITNLRKYISTNLTKIFNFLKFETQDLITYTKNTIRNVFKDKKLVILVFLINLLGVFAIILANFNYVDDIGRVANGYQGWDDYNRYTSVFLSTFLHADSYLTDISPLPQILASIIISISGIILINTINSNTKTIYKAFAIIPLGLSPYFLECLSYKYDSIYMALSIFGMILPLLYYKYNKYLYFLIVFLGTLLTTTTYQAALGIFPMSILLLTLIQWNKKESLKEIFTWSVISALGYLTGLLLFKEFIMSDFNNYISNDILPLSELIPNTILQYKNYITCFLNDFKDVWLYLIVSIIIISILSSIINSKQNKLLSLLVTLVTFILMALLQFGIYPLMAQCSYYPRAMFGIGAFICLISLNINFNKLLQLLFIPVIALGWCFFAFTFTYGNALIVQNDWGDFRIELVVQDISELDIINNSEYPYIYVQLNGNIGDSEILSNMPQNYSILNRLIPTIFSSGLYYTQYKFYEYYKLYNVRLSTFINFKEMDLEIIKDTYYHTISIYENYILIELK